MCGFASFVAVGIYEINDAVQVADIPTTSVLVHKFGKLTVKLPEICSELPLRPRGGILSVRDTAPRAESTAGIVGAFIRVTAFRCPVRVLKEISTGKDGQNPRKAVVFHDHIHGKPTEKAVVLLVPGGICRLFGIGEKLCPFVCYRFLYHPFPPPIR